MDYQQPEQGNKSQNEGLFFDVMPEPGKRGATVDPAQPMTISDSHLTQYQGSGSNGFLKLVASLLTIGLIGAAGWVGYQKGIIPKIPDSVLSKIPFLNKTTSEGPAVIPDTQTPVVTTSTTPEWLTRYFGTATCITDVLCGDSADPDRDGLSNKQEFTLTTDPNNPDSDLDGLADGDESNVFSTNPLSPRTNNNPKYTDADYINGGYSTAHTPDQKFTTSEIADINTKLKTFGLHQPSIGAIPLGLKNVYTFSPDAPVTATSTTPAAPCLPSSSGTPPPPGCAATSTPALPATTSPAVSKLPANLDQSAEAKQDRDTRRNTTIKNVSIAIIAYRKEKGFVPKTTSFTELFSLVKPYLRVATNQNDPIGVDPYVYKYEVSGTQDFLLTYQSETQNQLIRTRAAQAIKYQTAQEAEVNDDRRKGDLETIRQALLLYSADKAGTETLYLFPSAARYKVDLVPQYISQIPKDPKTNADYPYSVPVSVDSFTITSKLDNPPAGKTGYVCSQDECTYN